jgi:hypothetical protein
MTGKENPMIELTPEQARAVAEAAETPPTVLDPQTSTSYVLIREDVYKRLRGLLYDDTDLGHEQLRSLLARSAAGNAWDEPGMDAYDRYDEERAKRCR